jgi:hypothetical protein
MGKKLQTFILFDIQWYMRFLVAPSILKKLDPENRSGSGQKEVGTILNV